jgi:hypothetical protein
VHTNSFTPISGTLGLAGSVIYAPGTISANGNDYGAVVVQWTSDSAGKITFTTSDASNPRLNGFELSQVLVPEPTMALLLALGGLLFWRKCSRV